MDFYLVHPHWHYGLTVIGALEISCWWWWWWWWW